MIRLELSVREALNMVSNGCSLDMFEKIVAALEAAIGTPKTPGKMKVACSGLKDHATGWGNKIYAIKSIRVATGWGLKDAKDWIENCILNVKTFYTSPMTPEKANQLNDELTRLGCLCWVEPA